MFGLSAADILKILTEGLILPFLVLALFWKMTKDHDKDKKESLAREKQLREESNKREQRVLTESKNREDKLILESKEREDKLMNLLDKTSVSIEKVADSLDKLEFRMSLVEREIKIKE